MMSLIAYIKQLNESNENSDFGFVIYFLREWEEMVFPCEKENSVCIYIFLLLSLLIGNVKSEILCYVMLYLKWNDISHDLMLDFLVKRKHTFAHVSTYVSIGFNLSIIIKM